MSNKLKTGYELKEDILVSVNNIKPVPEVLSKARQMVVNPTTPLKDLTDLIDKDPSTTMKVLRLANSVYFKRREPATTVHEAALVLGTKNLSEMLLMAFASKPLGETLQGYDFKTMTLWQHSLAVAFASKFITEKNYPDFGDVAFTAGLIHDVGKIILDKYVFERADLIEQVQKEKQIPFYDAIRDVLGFDHAEIAAEICIRWNFPDIIAKAIKYHHMPQNSKGDILSYVVHVADQIAMWSCIDSDKEPLEIIDEPFRVLGLDMNDADIIMDYILESVSTITMAMQ